MALYYWVGGTNTWNATATGKWSALPGGLPTYVTAPGVADDVIFDSFSTAGTVVTLGSNATVGSITFATFPGTFTFAANLSSGNTTLGASTTYTASGGNPTTYTFTPRNVNSTFTANGKILPTNLFISLNGTTLTFADNTDFGGNLSTSNNAHTIKAATGITIDLRIGGNIVIGAMATNAADYVTIKGYGTSKTFSSGGGLNTNMRVTFVSGSIYAASANSSTAGTSFLTVETGGRFNAASIYTFSNSGTVTLSGFNASNNSDFFGTAGGVTFNCLTDIVIKSFIRITSSGTVMNCLGASKVFLEGDLTSVGTAITTIDRLEFSGTTASNVTAVSSGNNLQVKEFIINKTGGGSVNFNSNGIFALFVPNAGSYSFTHTNGIVTQNSTSIVRFYCNNTAATMTYSQTNMSFRYFEFAGGTLNLNSQLVATTIRLSPLAGTVTVIITSSTTFGFTVESLQAINTTGAAKTITLKSSVVYGITASLIMISTVSTAPITLNASIVGGAKAIFNLDNTASQTVEYVNATDIDSSGTSGVMPFSKQTIYSLAGTIAPTTINWSTGNQPPPIAVSRTVAYAFAN
jgi:hypothetical protein